MTKKGVIPDYEDDIFISYTHVDNDSYAKDQQGWVDYMHERLERRLYQLLGEQPAIWRDPKLNGNDYINNALIMKLRNIAILVAVLSPRYVKSEWCLKELAEFYRKSGHNDRARFLEAAPIFKVVKTPVSEYPAELRELLGYKFYEEDPLSGQPNEFSHLITFDTFPKFVKRVNDLAWGIKLFIETLQETPSGKLIPPTAGAVYLAVTTGEFEHERDEMKSELQGRGYRVLPNKDLPSDPADLMKSISDDLKKSVMSIHMVGKHFDGPESLAGLQHKLALERARHGKLSQVIWIPKGSRISDDERKPLMESLQQDANTHPGIEILQDMLEDLKTNILIKLKMVEGIMQQWPLPNNPEPKTDDPPLVYLVNDDLDYDSTVQLRNFLFDNEVEVLQIGTFEPNGEQKQTEELLQLRKDYTKDCDAMIIFQGQANDIWRGQKVSELRKCMVGRPKPLLGKAIYLSAPMNTAKNNFRSTELAVIKEQDEFPPESLVSFVNQVKSRFRDSVRKDPRSA